MDFSDEETPQVTCRSSATDNLEATAHATGQIESEHLRVAAPALDEDHWRAIVSPGTGQPLEGAADILSLWRRCARRAGFYRIPERLQSALRAVRCVATL
jgi:hypothetical protein